MKYNPQTLLKGKLNSVLPETYTATPTDETFVDTLGFSECLVILSCGTFTSTATMDVIINESASSNGSSPAAITSATFAQVSTANDEQCFVGRINLQDRLRYLGAACTFGGAGNAPIAVTIIPIGPTTTGYTAETYSFSVGD